MGNDMLHFPKGCVLQKHLTIGVFVAYGAYWVIPPPRLVNDPMVRVINIHQYTLA